jgi:hypothetical protein
LRVSGEIAGQARNDGNRVMLFSVYFRTFVAFFEATQALINAAQSSNLQTPRWAALRGVILNFKF